MKQQHEPSPYGLLTISRAARLLGISRPTVRRLVRDGSLTKLRIGNRPRIPSAAIERWIATQCDSAVARDNERSHPASTQFHLRKARHASPASEVSAGSRQ